jgi:hypothetical protein
VHIELCQQAYRQSVPNYRLYRNDDPPLCKYLSQSFDAWSHFLLFLCKFSAILLRQMKKTVNSAAKKVSKNTKKRDFAGD